MTEGLLTALLVLAGLLLLGLGVRYAFVRRHLKRLTEKVMRAARGDMPVFNLPEEEPYIEDIAKAVYALAVAQQARVVALDTERARLAAVLEQMTDGLLIVSASGNVQFANPAAERLFGQRDSLVGRSVTVALRHYLLVEAWRHAQETHEVQTQSVELSTSHQFLQLIVTPDQRTGSALLLVQDLTRVRRLETVRRDFISNVSHELRTPLASLKALTETLQESALDDPPAARRFLSRMQIEVDALTQMAAELLELSRIESGQVPLEFKSVAPEILLKSAVERMRAQAERAGLALTTDYPPALENVRADAPRMEQVLVNLIHNAVKFTRPGGKIDLSAQSADHFVRFCVQDTGIGIPPDVLPRIFERFYKADRARSSGGTGLGLSISRHLVEAHGGRIWAESEEGVGSAFYFTIPVERKT